MTVIFIPLVVILTKTPHQPDTEPSVANTTKDFTRTQVLKDPRFYAILPAYLFLPFFITGIFIHQNLLAEAKNWSMELMATSFISYGISKVATSLVGGALIDRFSAKKVFGLYLLPLALGLGLILLIDHIYILFFYMALLGITASLGSLTGVAMWAELYGVKNLGAIKSMTTTFMVIGTAVGPIVIGAGLNTSFSVTLILSITTILTLSTVCLLATKRST